MTKDEEKKENERGGGRRNTFSDRADSTASNIS
jgi:hypothetical protein